MSEEMALSLLEELMETQSDLIAEMRDLSLSIQCAETVEVIAPASYQVGH